MHLSEISIYPVKSCAGISLPAVELDRFGPVGDRRWMIVSEGGGFLSQRETPAMALIQVGQSTSGIRLVKDDSIIEIDEPGASAPMRRVTIWEDRVPARDGGDEAAAWVSHHLGLSCRLVFMPEETVRRVDGAWAKAGETVGFADGFPVLLISQASLDDLNARLPEPVPMNRFRPNLVVTGSEPFAEDGWR
ncbi:MAG: MOSC N-terminal beta barrel domain-containing protein, partial [Halioglobus sp.]